MSSLIFKRISLRILVCSSRLQTSYVDYTTTQQILVGKKTELSDEVLKLHSLLQFQ